MIEGGANSLRLSFAPVSADRADEGVSRIAAALERVRSTSAA
jgi:DNA-binding transcriptional MocR family regulator